MWTDILDYAKNKNSRCRMPKYLVEKQVKEDILNFMKGKC